MATILVVDDHPDNRRYLVKLLGYGGHRLVEAADGAEALMKTREEHPDLIISDILMPTMDGCEFVRQLRADPAFAQGPPVIFCTAAYREREAHALAEACGVRNVLVKPVRPAVVLNLVAETLPADLAAPPFPTGPVEAGDCDPAGNHLAARIIDLEVVNARLTALVDLSRQLMLEHDPLRLTASYCKASRDLLSARFAAIGLLTEDGRELASFSLCGHETETNVPPPLLAGLVRKVLQERRPVKVRDLQSEPEADVFLPPHPRRGSFLGVAIASSSQVYGLLYLIDKRGVEEFTAEDETLAVTLAAQVGVGYRAARQYEEIQRHAARLEQEGAQRRQAEEALGESQHRLQALFDNAPSLMLLIDDQARFIDANASACEHLGYSREEMLGLTLWDVTPASHQEHARKLWPSFIAEGKRDGEFTYRRKNGSTFEGEFRAVANIVPGVHLAIVQDVSQRKQAAVELKRQKEVLQTIFDHIPVMISFIDPAGRVQLVNRHWEEVLGWSLEEARTLDVFALTYPDPVERKETLDYIRRGEPGWRDFKTRVRDGRVLDTCWANVLLSDGMSIGIGQDVTEGRRVEEALRHTEARYRILVEQLPAITYQTSLEDGASDSYISPQVERLLGFTQAEWMADPGLWFERIHPEDAWSFLTASERLRVTGEPFQLEYRLLARDRQFPVKLSKSRP